ncbi:MAG: molecular chaperone DnaJ [Actinomycetota bacterium]
MAATDEIRREWFEKDYYAILGVAKNATQTEIKKAYRKLAQQHHPDANAGDPRAEERFKELSAAYDVIGDEGKRAAYDRAREMGAAGFAGGSPNGGQGRGYGGYPGGVRFETGDVDLEDLLGGMFGGAPRRRTRPSRGADLETDVTLSFGDAMSGVTLPVTLTGPAPCTTCHGSGAAPGTQPVVCPTCSGSGQIAVNQGLFSMAQTCPQCRGTGRVIETPCPTCGGVGSTRRKRTIHVKVPAGVKDGARIKLSGKGESGAAGGPAGDLYVRVHVRADDRFGRKGDDLTIDVPVTFPEAALGAHVDVPTLREPVTLKVPAGTPSGKTFRVRGKGAPKKGGGHGDLLATVVVDVPRKLSREQKKLVEQLAEATETSPRAGLGVS